MEVDKNGRLLELEPSEEFPILFGLLTERKKRTGAPAGRHGSNCGPRRGKFATSSNKCILVEPDSSTPDDCSCPLDTETDTDQLPGHSATTSPLLILRLTAPDNMNRRCPRRVNQEFQVIQPKDQEQCSLRRRRTTKVISNEDECMPSSTTVDDEERPSLKRFRPDSRDEELDMPQLEPMVTTSSLSTDSSTLPAFGYWRQNGHEDENRDVLPVSSGGSSVFYNPDAARSYSCSYCHLKFTRQFHLLRHMAVHEDKREVCCHCNTAFYRKDNLLVHQSKCLQQQEKLGKRQLRSAAVQSRPARPPPRTLADLLDRDYDQGKYGPSDMDHGYSPLNNINNHNNSYNIQLPSGLEISEVPNSNNPSDGQELTCPSSPLPRRRRVIETINLAEGSDEEPEPNENNDVEIFPCGHCREVFETFSRLLKHTAAKHIKNPTDGTFHFEIETILDE